MQNKEDSPVHMPKRFSTFRVSILCILFASTVKTGAANRVGMAGSDAVIAKPGRCELRGGNVLRSSWEAGLVMRFQTLRQGLGWITYPEVLRGRAESRRLPRIEAIN